MRRKRILTPDGLWVLKNRRRLGWSQHRLAASINQPYGIHSGRICEIETGQKPLRPEWREQMQCIFTQGT